MVTSREMLTYIWYYHQIPFTLKKHLPLIKIVVLIKKYNFFFWGGGGVNIRTVAKILYNTCNKLLLGEWASPLWVNIYHVLMVQCSGLHPFSNNSKYFGFFWRDFYDKFSRILMENLIHSKIIIFYELWKNNAHASVT